jgi:very-short-patch-repair endonuclease
MDDVELEPAYLWRESRERGARRRELTAAGRRISRGLYLSHAEDPSLEVRCRAWALLLPPDAAFGMETAALLLGLPVPEVPRAVQVVMRPRPVLPQRRGLRVHVRQLTGADVMHVDGLRLTSPAQLFLDLAARWPPEEVLALGDGLLRGRHLTAQNLAARLARADRVRGVVRARELAPRLSDRSHSRAESLIRYWLEESDLPDPELQIPVHDRWGREAAHADLGYGRWKLALEYEGRQHADPDQCGRDIDRYSLMAADGWVVLRFAKRHLNGPWTVVERTRRTLLHRGWRP